MGESTATDKRATATPERLEKIASQIRRMLAEADALESGDTSIYATENAKDEAATAARVANLRAMAEKFMRDYRIEEEQLIAEDSFSITPVVRDITISNYRSDFYMDHLGLWVWTADHSEILFKANWSGYDLVVTAVGYASDIRHAEGLYQAAWLTMVAQLEPKVDTKLSDKENVYRLRSAGMERNKIASMLWNADLGKGGHAAHAKVGKLYAEACAERGERPVAAGKGLNKAVYRESYGDAFVSRFAERLRAARDAADSMGGTVALHGRKERVQEAYWERFPEEHPDARKAAREAREAQEGNTKAIKKKEPRWTKKQQADWDRRHNSVAARAGKGAGRIAADKVEIARTTEPTMRVEAEPSPNGRGIALGS